jgi:glycosyltransferase involved in cell wall biosynthesis
LILCILYSKLKIKTTRGDAIVAIMAAIVPCYNPGKVCQEVFEQLPNYVDRVLAIDDASTDETPTILRDLGIETITHPVNRGKGAALLGGFNHLLQDPQVHSILTIDSDGQHQPRDIPLLAAALKEERVGVVVGSRMEAPDNMPIHRRLANSISSGLISWVAGQKIPDSQSGFRLHSRALLEEILPNISGDHFEMETELLIRACRAEYRVLATPIPSIYTEDALRSSSYHPIRDSWRIGKIIFKFMWEPRR